MIHEKECDSVESIQFQLELIIVINLSSNVDAILSDHFATFHQLLAKAFASRPRRDLFRDFPIFAPKMEKRDKALENIF